MWMKTDWWWLLLACLHEPNLRLLETTHMFTWIQMVTLRLGWFPGGGTACKKVLPQKKEESDFCLKWSCYMLRYFNFVVEYTYLDPRMHLPCWHPHKKRSLDVELCKFVCIACLSWYCSLMSSYRNQIIPVSWKQTSYWGIYIYCCIQVDFIEYMSGPLWRGTKHKCWGGDFNWLSPLLVGGGSSSWKMDQKLSIYQSNIYLLFYY